MIDYKIKDICLADWSFIMPYLFINHASTQIELFHNEQNYDRKVYTLSKILTEEVGSLHLKHVGAELDSLLSHQTEYIGGLDIESLY